MRAWLTVSLAVLLVALVLLPAAPSRADDPGPDDPRVATVVQSAGAALVRPLGRRRWTPLERDDALFPRDTLRAASRGANALDVALVGGGRLVLGPGALVDLPERGRVTLRLGEIEIQAPEGGSVALETPGGRSQDVEGTTWWRGEATDATRLDSAPRWLAGWRASTGDEWVGTLVAQVDGRDVPLSVGHYRTTVEIRDGIARTTIQEGFVNTTDQRLEGVFTFPLPADASISGFGMWVGDRLVEADIVERSRARQIYEDILRRKKDPGLLEWQGGNLFKARVYPIEGNAEKRIRIRYTQVLRLEGRTYRYRQALRSDLLQRHPLRRLDVEVNVASEGEIESVACVNHPCQVTQSEHAARLRFGADDVRPRDDLEVRIALAGDAPLAAVTHRRGEDGFFLLRIRPPEPEAQGWQRPLLPEGDGLDVVVLADTSGSMGPAAREAQSHFVRDLLEQLGEGDRFRLLAGDVTAVPYRPEAVPATRENVDAALQFLAQRASLGWSDLDALLAAGLDGAPDGALVVYVGDGIPTTGDADPAAAASRIRRLGEGHAVHVHAVATSNTYEKPVLEAMAAIGGGSVRRADEGALGAARTLLEEAARPPVRDMTVEVEGIDAAAVYPQHLPNLPVGTQQIVLGRLRPTKESRRGTVVIRGRLGGREVVYRAPIVLPAASGGNAFLPRLWARRHLDHLLAQGRTPAVQGEIVAFSRRYGIMTPYTSFLVLEDEADRERYGVEHQVSMRDGESFFLEAKDRAQLEARREAIRRTRLWRRGLRRRMVKEIAGLGRDRVPAASIRAVGWGWLEQAPSADGLLTVGDGHGTLLGRDIRLTGNLAFGYADADRIFEEEKVVLTGRGGAYRGPGGGVPPVAKAHSERVSRLAFHDVELVPSNFTPPGQRAPTDPTPPPPEEPAPEDLLPGKSLLLAGDGDNHDRGIQATSTFADTFAEESPVGERASKKNAPALEEPWTPAGVGFPPLAPKPPAEEEPAVPDGPKEVLGALRSIDLARSLPRIGQPYRLVETLARVHPVRGPALERAATTRVLVGPDRWHARSWQPGSSPIEAWLAGGERAVLDVGSGLGRRRPAVDGDAGRLPVPLALFAWSDLARRLERRPARVVEREGAVLHIAFEPRALRDPTLHLRIDTGRHALLEAWEERDGLTIRRRTFSDFVDLGGLAVARREDAFDARGDPVRRVFREVTPLSGDALERAVAEAVGAHEDAVWLGAADPTVAEARRARDDGTAGFAAWLVLALDGASASDDERTFAAWTAARQVVGDRPGLDLIEAELLANARRGEALKALLASVAAGPWHRQDAAACWLAEHLDHRAAGFLGPEERRALLETDGMRGRWWTGGPPAEVSWRLEQQHLKETAGRADEVEPFPARLPVLPTLADHVQGLALRGEVDEAVAAIDAWHALPGLWSREDRSWLHEQKTDLLWKVRRTEALRAATRAWTRDVPEESEAWRRAWSVLPLLDRAAEADAEVLHVLRAPVPADPLSPGWARTVTAVRLALGDGWWYSASRVAEPFQAPLADLAARLLRAGPPASDLAAQILANRRFRSTAAYDDLVRALREDLVTHGEDRTPSTLCAVLQALPWTSSSGLGPEEWSRIEDRVRERWEELPTLAARTSVAEALLAAADARSDREGALSLLRRWREREHGEDRRVLAARLVDRLLAGDWSGPAESEVVSLLGVVLPRERDNARQEAAAVLARRFAAWVEKGRRERNVAREGVEKREAAESARAEVADVLDLVAQEMGDPLAPFLEIERLGYAVEVGRDLVAVEGDARGALDAVPRGTDDAPALVRARRAVLVLDYAATRRSAPEGLPDRVLRMLAERDADPGDTRLDWRYERFRLLIVLGRLDEAEALLRAWTADAPPSNRWRPPLARLLAERGDMVEAAGVLEASRDQPAEVYALLATIDLALGKDDASEEATARRLDAMDVGDLQNALYAYDGSDLDPLGVRFAKALLAKAEFPTYHTWWVQRLYERTRDPRLLAAMAEAVPGHTAEGIYPLLADIRGIDVHEEAALDTVSTRARALAATASDAGTARALALLEAMWEARATKTPDPDADHVARALAALDRARETPLVPGEARLLADFLEGWGALPLPALADARRTWLEEIAAAHAGPTAVDLDIHASYAAVLAAEGEKTRAADVLERAIARVREDHPGGLPPGPTPRSTSGSRSWATSDTSPPPRRPCAPTVRVSGGPRAATSASCISCTSTAAPSRTGAPPRSGAAYGCWRPNGRRSLASSTRIRPLGPPASWTRGSRCTAPRRRGAASRTRANAWNASPGRTSRRACCASCPRPRAWRRTWPTRWTRSPGPRWRSATRSTGWTSNPPSSSGSIATSGTTPTRRSPTGGTTRNGWRTRFAPGSSRACWARWKPPSWRTPGAARPSTVRATSASGPRRRTRSSPRPRP